MQPRFNVKAYKLQLLPIICQVILKQIQQTNYSPGLPLAAGFQSYCGKKKNNP